MKIFLQTEILAADSDVVDPRPRVALLETAAAPDAVKAALDLIASRLGVIAAIPAPAHEANLRHLLRRDLAELGVAPGPGAEDDAGEAVLRVRRTPKNDAPTAQGEVYDLAYEVQVR
jgi:hypothetical protein